MTENPNHPDGRPQRGDAPSSELHGLIEPDRSNQRRVGRSRSSTSRPCAPSYRPARNAPNVSTSGEEGKERSRRTRIYSHNWIIEKEDYALTPAVAQDAIRLAANCDFELMLSADCPELDPKFEPHRIAFNGRGDAADDFTYPPDLTDPRVSNFLGNRGKCRTECRDYDTLVSTVLLSVKHHLGKKAYVTSNGRARPRGLAGRLRTLLPHLPGTEIPWLDNWPHERDYD